MYAVVHNSGGITYSSHLLPFTRSKFFGCPVDLYIIGIEVVLSASITFSLGSHDILTYSPSSPQLVITHARRTPIIADTL